MRHSLKKRHPGVAVRYLLMVLVSFLDDAHLGDAPG